MPVKLHVDPRLVELAYVTDGKHLFEVVASVGGTFHLENCQTGYRVRIALGDMLRTFRLVKAAPSCSDSLEAEQAK